MLTKKSKYAIKALIAIARNNDSTRPMPISLIAEQENISRKFLETILLDFKKHGILASKSGANGGYYLHKKPKDIFLSQIIRVTDGPIAIVPCVSLNFYEKCYECINEAECALHDVAIKVRDASLKILSKTSLKDLVEKEQKLKNT